MIEQPRSVQLFTPLHLDSLEQNKVPIIKLSNYSRSYKFNDVGKKENSIEWCFKRIRKQ